MRIAWLILATEASGDPTSLRVVRHLALYLQPVTIPEIRTTVPAPARGLSPDRFSRAGPDSEPGSQEGDRV
jgi:hypothetical protein